jgi:hypothetical protein
MSAHAINGKTPYEVKNKRKLNLAGIQEFRAAAYIKDQKLDAQAKKGRFVRYDSAKGYRIYWPDKRSISVERNIVSMMTMSNWQIIPPSFMPRHSLRGREIKS